MAYLETHGFSTKENCLEFLFFFVIFSEKNLKHFSKIGKTSLNQKFKDLNRKQYTSNHFPQIPFNNHDQMICLFQIER